MILCLCLYFIVSFLSDTVAEKKIAVLVGGTNAGIGSEIVFANTACDGNLAHPQFPNAAFSHQFGWVAGVHSIAESPYAILCGGMDATQSDECFSLKLGNDYWEQGSCKMPNPRSHASIFSTMDGRVVISGGYNEQVGWLSDILVLEEIRPDECSEWNSQCCTWENLGSFNYDKVYAHCSLQYDEDHYVFLGGNTWSDEYGQYDVPTVQILNTRTGQWSKGQDMPAPRQRTSCIKTEIDGRQGILVAGGYCHGNPTFDNCYQLRLDDTIFYDFEADEWKTVGSLNSARSGLYMAEVQDRILVMGGEYRGNPKDTVEEWNPVEKRWVITNFTLPTGLESFAAFTCSDDYYMC